MGRLPNKVSATSGSTPGRRSLRNSKPSEDVRVQTPTKSRKSVTKKKDEKLDSKSDEEKQEVIEELPEDNAPQIISEVEGNSANVKPASSRSLKAGKKRQASESIDVEEKEKSDKEPSSDKNSDELKNGKAEPPTKGSAKKKKKKPITKKKKEQQDESEMWTPLEPLDGDEKKENQRKPQSKNDRRKQALVEREAHAEPMLQKQLPRQRRNSDATECVVLDSRIKTIVTVDIDDEASETGSIQIVTDVDTVFDFKRLLIQYRSVNLPSSLWGVHKDPRNQFVSFTRFNPDYPETNGVFVDRAVVFKGCLNPEVYVNGEKVEIPEMFHVVETLLEASQVIQFINNTVSVMSPTTQEPSNEDG